MRRGLLLALCLLAAACRMESGLRSGDMRGHLDTQFALFSSQSLSEIAELEPSRQEPLRLAIAPPIGQRYEHADFWLERPSRLGSSSVDAWMSEERAAIEQACDDFVARGLISDAVFLPGLLIEDGGDSTPLFDRIQLAAARHGADAVLVVHSIDASDSWSNALSFTYLALLPAFLVPGSEGEARTMVEGLVLDTRTQYLYATAFGEARGRVTGPIMSLENALEQELSKTHVAAIAALGQAFAAKDFGTAP